LGFTAEEAARRYIERQTNEYKTKTSARIKGEDINKIAKDNLRVGDIGEHFDPSWLPFNTPAVGQTAGVRDEMFKDYEQLFRENYARSGDVSHSKARALKQLERTWQVSRVTGSPVVMRYAPERAPAYKGIDNAADLIADQAIAAIREQSGQEIKRNKLVFTPVGTKTSMPYWRGEPPPYVVSWQDDGGVWHDLGFGKGFVADPAPMRAGNPSELDRRTRASRERRETTPNSVGNF
jgi:hypothetical protein